MIKKDYAYIISETICKKQNVKPALIRKIFRNEQKRWWVMHGLYYGYPICCILDFCTGGVLLQKIKKCFLTQVRALCLVILVAKRLLKSKLL